MQLVDPVGEFFGAQARLLDIVSEVTMLAVGVAVIRYLK
jgi:hypothetical protein